MTIVKFIREQTAHLKNLEAKQVEAPTLERQAEISRIKAEIKAADMQLIKLSLIPGIDLASA